MAGERTDPWQWRALLIRELALPSRQEEVPLTEALGRVLAADVTSPEDLPAEPLSAMDGFAVRRADLGAGTPTGEIDMVLPVLAELPARPGRVGALPPGAAARIMTGASVPEGADLVIPVEDTDADPVGPAPERVRIRLAGVPRVGRHVRRRGEEVALGTVLAERGRRVGPGLIGLGRALGIGTLPVLAPPRVVVVVTGDELTGAQEVTAAGAVRESNGEMLVAALAADGADASRRHSGDDPTALRAVLERAAAEADLVLTTGGIGSGAYDVVKQLLGEHGAGTSRFAHLALRPGGPQGWGRLPGGTPIVHLPGTPVGAFVGHHLFVRPLLPGVDPAPRRLPLGADGGDRGDRADGVGRADGVLRALPGLLRRDVEGRESIDVLPGSRLAPYGRADALVLRDDGPGALVLPL